MDAGGNVNASETAKGIVEEATDAEVTAGTATGATGAKLFVTPAKLATYLPTAYQPTTVYNSGSTSKTLSDSNGATQTIAHGLGRTPKLVRIKTAAFNAGEGYIGEGTWSNSKYASHVFWVTTAASNAEVSTSYIIKLSQYGTTSAYQTATVAVDSTNITLTWAKTNSPTATIDFVWEASS